MVSNVYGEEVDTLSMVLNIYGKEVYTNGRQSILCGELCWLSSVLSIYMVAATKKWNGKYVKRR